MRGLSLPLCALALSLAGQAPGALTYTCDPSVTATACAYLNTTVAGLYNSTFTNVTASIYVKIGNTGLGESEYFLNFVTYSQYIAALTAASQSSGNSVQVSAVNALNSIDTALYGNYQVEVSSPLGRSFGFQNLAGTDQSGSKFCPDPGSSGCYDGVITISNSVALYYREGTEPRNAYDFYSTVEHETDEILGTSSCIDTTGRSLSNGCGDNILAAVDLFRYQSAGNPVLIGTTPGAYFSYDGGQTNGAGAYQKVYNTLSNGDDYADFLVPGCPPAHASVQDAEACSGDDGNLDITNDGGAEIAILNAVGFSVASQTTPAPAIKPNGVVPVFSTSTTVQPGEWISIYGSNLGPSSPVTWKGDFPTALGGTSVTVDNIPAYLWYVGAGQINLQVPNDPNINRSVPVVVTVGTQKASANVTLAAVAPSFSLLDSSHVAGIILRSNGSGAYGGGTYDIVGPTGTSLGYPTVAAKAGDTVELFGVGFGPTSPAVAAGQLFTGAASTDNPVTLSIQGRILVPGFAGETSAGLYQINLTIPAGLGTGDVPLIATVDGSQTQAGVVISLQ